MATGPTEKLPPLGEFELIDTLFAPLAQGLAGSFGLKDDVAALSPKPGHELILKTDSVIENVHFLSADPAATVAQKALRRALSDLAAKGAVPEAYLLAIALPVTVNEDWLQEFAEGLAREQEQFGVVLAGGETNRTPGVLTITITAIGWVAQGRLVRRSGAAAGDEVWVTGTIGDASGGLALLKSEDRPTDKAAEEFLTARFRIPEPRVAFGKLLAAFATAAIDVSDGLLADLGHIADVSTVRIEVDAHAVPLSAELRALWGEETTLRAISAGDDYEIAFTASSSAESSVRKAAESTGTRVTRIGRVSKGAAGIALIDRAGCEISVPRKGYAHF